MKPKYFFAEPIVFQAAIFLMKQESDIEKHFMEFVLYQVFNKHLSADAKGKMMDKLIALRFGLGWWENIPYDDSAWNEFPEEFQERIRNLEAPSFIFHERTVDDNYLAMTLFQETSPIYVIPADKSGLDGCYRFIGYLGRCSFTPQNLAEDCFISSIVENKNHPLLFICGEFPFYGPLNTPLPRPKKTQDNNWIIHLDLRSRLTHYLLGPELMVYLNKYVSTQKQQLQQQKIIPNLSGPQS